MRFYRSDAVVLAGMMLTIIAAQEYWPWWATILSYSVTWLGVGMARREGAKGL